MTIEDAEKIVALLNGLRAAYEDLDLVKRLDEMQRSWMRSQRRLEASNDHQTPLDASIGAVEVATIALKRSGRIRSPMLFLSDPEDDLSEFKLPDWVVDKLGVIEIATPPGCEYESGPEWVARLTAEAVMKG